MRSTLFVGLVAGAAVIGTVGGAAISLADGGAGDGVADVRAAQQSATSPSTSMSTSMSTPTSAPTPTSTDTPAPRLGITAERAAEIALGATRGGQVTEVEREEEHGRPVWDVEIVNDGQEYDVHVDAETGAVPRVRSDDRDDDDDRHGRGSDDSDDWDD